MNSNTSPAPWYTNLLLVVGVTLTVVMALLMSQLDRLQTRLVPTVAVMAELIEPTVTPTPLSAIALATAMPANSASPPSGEGFTTSDGTAVATVECSPPPEGWVSYIVQSSDTLFALANSTGTTVDEIQRVNCLGAQPLITNMQVYLPGLPPTRCGPPYSWVRYIVQAGDTMFSLAVSRGTSVAQVMRANCLDSERLYTGRQIYLPPGGVTAVPTATPVPSPTRTNPPRPTKTAVPPPTLTSTPPPVATFTPTNTPVPPTNTPTNTPTNVPTITPSPTTAPSGNATLNEPPGVGALGLTAFWLGLGLVAGLFLVTDNPLERKRP